VLLLVLALGAFLYWASLGFDADAPAPEPERAEVDREWANQVPATPETLRLLAFNMAYGRGPVDDIGDPRERAEIERHLDDIVAFLRASEADVVALQEVDYDAHRTFGIDQLDYLAQGAGYPYRARITTWKVNYVPFPYWPPAHHIGRMHSGQAVISRYPLRDNRRVVLPQPESYAWYYNRFYLHRSIQMVTVEVGERPLRIFNCHLEAFDVANREEHARRLAALVSEAAVEDWVVLGDMNSPPPEAPQRANFEDEPGWDASQDTTVEILREGLGVHEVPTYEQGHESTFTFPAEAPTRRLDFLFVSPTLPVQSARVVHEAGPISDHLPVEANVSLGSR
jgi:endonuclease/exonuclease/phosphatase family metal-dependent hydrolase